MQQPKIGQYWAGHGGYYAGIVRDPATNKSWHLIMHPDEISSTWGEMGAEISGEFSHHDGQHNSNILAATGESELVTKIQSMQLDGHHDYYLPATKELQLLGINLCDKGRPVFHWSSTQDSAGYAWFVDFEDGLTLIYSKDFKRAVRAVRRLPIE